MNKNFTVGVRLRPTNENHNNISIEINTNELKINNPSFTGYSKTKKYLFDHLFNNDCQNQNIFDAVMKQKLDLIKDGYNVSLMAYGVTGSGKTYTIFGNQLATGLAELSYQYIMEKLPNYCFSFSFLQIYNEHVHDLLSKEENLKNLSILEDANGKIIVSELQSISVGNVEDIMKLISQGSQRRTISSNHINEFSSRSHAILQLNCLNIQNNVQCKLTIIDLAGSEKNSTINNNSTSNLTKQGSSINRSLLTLGNCIKRLQNQNTHIPYRDSKLTRILKDNLSGLSYNLMIACISSNSSQYEQTLNTLQYASRASRIQKDVISMKQLQNYNTVHCPNCNEKINLSQYCENMSKQLKPKQKNYDDLSKIKTNIKHCLEQYMNSLNKILHTNLPQESSVNEFLDLSTSFSAFYSKIERQTENLRQSILASFDSSNQKPITQKNKSLILRTPLTNNTLILDNSKSRSHSQNNKLVLTLDLSQQRILTDRSQTIREEFVEKLRPKKYSISFKTQLQSKQNLKIPKISYIPRMLRDLQTEVDIQSWKKQVLSKISTAIKKKKQTEISEFGYSKQLLAPFNKTTSFEFTGIQLKSKKDSKQPLNL